MKKYLFVLGLGLMLLIFGVLMVFYHVSRYMVAQYLFSYAPYRFYSVILNIVGILFVAAGFFIAFAIIIAVLLMSTSH